ncbi:tyrosine-type recombinase/integrase [Bacillus mycoides]|uniref:tyrosine-type recombinase/integrase n=1 Tax=Bacillus mycoides TaxID=1405 RepID=UPI001C014951|nr:tyrosine-type recombinase/integrase [Bacillus mycoides]QWG91678.1 transposase [Bacillus mycoides]
MRVKEIITTGNRTRYVLVDQTGNIVDPVNKFLKFKDNSNSARGTLRSYAYGLCLYFKFLEQKQLLYYDVGIDDFAEYIRWLQNPYQELKVITITPKSKYKIRKTRTINQYINKVYNFYEYIMRHEDYTLTLSERLKKQISGNISGYKSFLYHIKNNRTSMKRILKVPEPKERLKILTRDEVETLIDACNNIRDKFLLLLLYETGMRIGEALSLHLSDIVPAMKKLYIQDRGELINGAEIKTVCSPRILDIPENLANLYRTYIFDIHTEEVDTDFIFIKLTGSNKFEPLDYLSTQKIFNRLEKRTGIPVTAHMFRHTNLTELWRTGEMRPETLKERAGHAHIQTTMQMYVHPSEEDIRQDWENAMAKKTTVE